MPSLKFILSEQEEEDLEKDLPEPIKMTRQQNCYKAQLLDGSNLKMVRTRPRLYAPLIGRDLMYYGNQGNNLELVSSASTNFDSDGPEEAADEHGDAAMHFDDLDFDDLM